jgi:hypothetical protein
MCFLHWYRTWKRNNELAEMQRNELKKRSEEIERAVSRSRQTRFAMLEMKNKG